MKFMVPPVHSYASSTVRRMIACRGQRGRHGARHGGFGATLLQRHVVASERKRRASAVAKPSFSTEVEAKTEADGPDGRFILYNTKGRKKEEFYPLDDKLRKVTMYVCGVTVYDYSHIGHARVYTVFDVLYRYLKWRGYDVVYCRNFTDIDDKIIKRANEMGEECGAVTERFIDEFHADMTSLGNLEPTLEPRATEHIDDMIEQIGKIISNGHAYAVEGDVYFDVRSLNEYGTLSGRKQEDNRAGERVVVDERKKDPADFALWKAKKDGEPYWESPWGQGRPGWHIECSSMIHKLLGPEIDIHGGGQDLAFPHHENELAQSMAACKQCPDQLSRFWVHNGFVNVNTEKMSKSLGNFFTIRDVLERYHAMAVRFFLLSTHYRSAINFSDALLEEASARAWYLYQIMADCEALPDLDLGTARSADYEASEEMASACLRAMGDDLATQQTLSLLSPALKTVNELLHTKKGRKNPERNEALRGYYSGISEVLGVLGLSSENYGEVLAGMKTCALGRCNRTAKDVERLIEERKEARANKDFEKSDKIREDLTSDGIALLDTPQGTEWRPVSMV